MLLMAHLLVLCLQPLPPPKKKANGEKINGPIEYWVETEPSAEEEDSQGRAGQLLQSQG